MGSDHHPLSLVIGVQLNSNSKERGAKTRKTKREINWKGLSKEQKQNYAWEVTEILNSSPGPEVFECKEEKCNNRQHIRDINGVCEYLTEVTKKVEEKLGKMRKHGKRKIAGWGDAVGKKYSEYKEIHLEWVRNGRKSEGEIFEKRKEKHRIYKGAVRF